jgi:hypothetical protein
MKTELTQLGESALSAWTGRDAKREERLAFSATMLARFESAVEASGLFPELATSLGEAVRQFEHGSVALLMHLTPLAADAGRRIIEVIYYTVFLRTAPLVLNRRTVSLASWLAGDALFSFSAPLKSYYKAHAVASSGPYGEKRVLDLYKDLSAYVHGNPQLWAESRVGLSLVATQTNLDKHEAWLVSVAKTCACVILLELPDLAVDELDVWFDAEWNAVKSALGLP